MKYVIVESPITDIANPAIAPEKFFGSSISIRFPVSDQAARYTIPCKRLAKMQV
jgi:hypothetical protein